MRFSRTRLQLSLWIAGTVFVALTLLDAAFYGFLVRDARTAFRGELLQEATGIQAAILDNRRADGETALRAAVIEALSKWPGNRTLFVVYDSADGLLGTRGSADEIAALRTVSDPIGSASTWTMTLGGDDTFMAIEHADGDSPRIKIIAARSMESLQEFQEVLTGWISLSIPAVSLLAVVSGFFLARRSLRPVVQMSRTIAHIAPDALDTRLIVRHPPDEIDQLADQFNSLLARLAAARERNRQFLARAAHQIRTPLTIVRGEAELSLEESREADEYVAALRRIGAAATQMAHRVNELFLMDAEAGEAPSMTDEIELDGVAFECTDLMRGRAAALGKSLELSRVEPGAAAGNQVLIREAVIELIENALRHGGPHGTVRVSAFTENGNAHLVVSNDGASLDLPDRPEAQDHNGSDGLGLTIVQWIADVHRGALRYWHDNGENRVAIIWPVVHAARHGPAPDHAEHPNDVRRW